MGRWRGVVPRQLGFFLGGTPGKEQTDNKHAWAADGRSKRCSTPGCQMGAALPRPDGLMSSRGQFQCNLRLPTSPLTPLRKRP